MKIEIQVLMSKDANKISFVDADKDFTPLITLHNEFSNVHIATIILKAIEKEVK